MMFLLFNLVFFNLKIENSIKKIKVPKKYHLSKNRLQ
jgi:hypothetical protein